MRTKIILPPSSETEADGYRETVAPYELSGTLVVLTATYQGGKFLAHTIRKGTMSALKRRVGEAPHSAVTSHDAMVVTEKLFQDEVNVMPGQLPARVEVAYQERALEFLDAAGASAHVKLHFAQRLSA